jgi:hypothetical protein
MGKGAGHVERAIEAILIAEADNALHGGGQPAVAQNAVELETLPELTADVDRSRIQLCAACLWKARVRLALFG